MHYICKKIKSELENIEDKVKRTNKLTSQEVHYVNILTKTLDSLTDMIEDYYPEEMSELKSKDKNVYDEWSSTMTNEDGDRGVYWTKIETTEVAKNNGITFDSISEDDWFIAMNMIYSDYSQIAKKYGVDTISFYVDMTKQWLWDKDTIQGKCKLMSYYYNIVKPHK